MVRLLDKQNEPVEQAFLSDLKRSIEIQESSKRNKEPSHTYKPSGMKCKRAMVFERVGYPRDEEALSYTLVGICNAGSDIHERIQKAVCEMKDSGIDCEYADVQAYIDSRICENIGRIDYLEIKGKQGMETKLYDCGLHMSFLCDGIVKYKSKYYILELKTETTNKFWSRKGVDPNHYNQATAYSLALGIPDVLFVYICRDNLEMKSFLFKVTDEMRTNLQAMIEDCENHVINGTIPDIPEEASAKFCQYCGYKQYCGS